MPRAKLRLRAVQIGFAVALSVLIVRAAQVQLVEGARHEARAQAQRTARVELPALRGAIYDRNRVPLALTQTAFHVGVAPHELLDRDRTARELSRHLGLSLDQIQTEFRRDWAYFHGPFTSNHVFPLRGTRGVHLTTELVRFHPNPDLARSVVGRPAAPGRPASGIERVMDAYLAGRPGRAVVLRDQFGRRYESPARLDELPRAGHDVLLTIDMELQDLVERALADAIERLDARGGDVIVVDPRTGEVLALASRLADGQSTAGPFTAVFEPGSTAKIFAAAALLTHGLVQPTDSVWGEEGVLDLGYRTIEDDHPEGWMTLREAIRRSSNIGVVKLGDRLAPEQQFGMLRAFGIGTPTGIEFPAESPGILGLPATWSAASPASLAIGYEVAVTMVQLAAAYAAIANDGVLLRPTLIHSIRSPDGEEVRRHVPEPIRRVVSPAVARELRSMLRDVVYEGGTGDTAALVSYELAGKTGTARRAGPDGYVPGAISASFASMFPADDPQLVMVVKLEDPKGSYARATAAPLTRLMLEQVLAARTPALDRAALTGTPASPQPGPPVDAGIVPYVTSWPVETVRRDDGPRSVPDVTGLSLRAAARRLHRLGLRVRAEGWGPVAETVPAAGTAVPPGTLIRVLGGESP